LLSPFHHVEICAVIANNPSCIACRSAAGHQLQVPHSAGHSFRRQGWIVMAWTSYCQVDPHSLCRLVNICMCLAFCLYIVLYCVRHVFHPLTSRQPFPCYRHKSSLLFDVNGVESWNFKFCVLFWSCWVGLHSLLYFHQFGCFALLTICDSSRASDNSSNHSLCRQKGNLHLSLFPVDQ